MSRNFREDAPMMACSLKADRMAPLSNQASSVAHRGSTAGLAKHGREIARGAEAAVQCDLRHRSGRVSQQDLGPLDAFANVIAMRRHTERLLERPSEMGR